MVVVWWTLQYSPTAVARKDYVTSQRLFSADTRWGLRNLLLPTTQQLQSGGCRQTTNAVDLSCIMFAAFGHIAYEYRLNIVQYSILPDTTKYLDTRYCIILALIVAGSRGDLV